MVPNSTDVLLGRGRGCFKHVGNIRYRSLVEERKEKYEKASKKEKTRIAEAVIDLIERRGGRFLKGADGHWMVVDIKTKVQKVAHSFRALRSSSSSNTRTVAPALKRMSRD